MLNVDFTLSIVDIVKYRQIAFKVWHLMTNLVIMSGCSWGVGGGECEGDRIIFTLQEPGPQETSLSEAQWSPDSRSEYTLPSLTQTLWLNCTTQLWQCKYENWKVFLLLQLNLSMKAGIIHSFQPQQQQQQQQQQWVMCCEARKQY